MRGPRRDVTARELGALAVGACLLSVVMNWPLVLHLGEHIPKDLGDPLAESWQLGWDGHALIHQPLHFFQSNQFWPLHDTLAFSDALVGYAPVSWLGSGPHAAVFRYDVIFLFAYALAFAGAYLLARELGLGPGAAVVAGAAFAYAPYRLEQDGHMQVISSGGIPLALALGVRGFRLRRPWWVGAAWAVAAWQLTIGFTLGLPLGYLLVAIGVIAAIAWLRRGRPRLDRGLAVATVAGAVAFAAVGFALSRPYVRVADAHPAAKRTASEVEAFSGPPWAFLVAPDENLVWGAATGPLRDGLSNVPEETLFPGLVILGLAIGGLGSSAYPRWLRRGLGVGTVVVMVLALGFQAGGGLLWPYRLVYEVLPGWQAIRVPGRLVAISSLGLALLAGAGAERTVAGALRRRRAGTPAAPGEAGTAGTSVATAWGAATGPGVAAPEAATAATEAATARREATGRAARGIGPKPPPGWVRSWVGPAVAAALALVVLVEGRGLPFDPFGNRAQPQVSRIPPSTASVPAPQLHLPALRATDNRRYILWSTDGFPALVNGRSSLNPGFTEHLIRHVEGFPSRKSVALLARLGVRSVVLHADRVARTPWHRAAKRSVAGLPLTRTRRGELVIYEIDPSHLAD
jgi:hypothetical protein